MGMIKEPLAVTAAGGTYLEGRVVYFNDEYYVLLHYVWEGWRKVGAEPAHFIAEPINSNGSLAGTQYQCKILTTEIVHTDYCFYNQDMPFDDDIPF